MRYVAIVGIVCLGTGVLSAGCEESTEGETGGGGNGTASSSSSGDVSSSSSSSGAGGGGGGMASSSSSSASSSSSGMLINGCDKASAVDMTASAMVKVAVGANMMSVYSPACIRIKKGMSVTFEGNFATHPTVGGTVSPSTPDSASPIKQTMSGTAATFKFDLVGTYPYYCEYHAPTMAGVVFVE